MVSSIEKLIFLHRSVKSMKAESDVIIPESPDSDNNDSTDMSLHDRRFEKVTQNTT